MGLSIRREIQFSNLPVTDSNNYYKWVYAAHGRSLKYNRAFPFGSSKRTSKSTTEEKGERICGKGGGMTEVEAKRQSNQEVVNAYNIRPNFKNKYAIFLSFSLHSLVPTHYIITDSI